MKLKNSNEKNIISAKAIPKIVFFYNACTFSQYDAPSPTLSPHRLSSSMRCFESKFSLISLRQQNEFLACKLIGSAATEESTQNNCNTNTNAHTRTQTLRWAHISTPAPLLSCSGWDFTKFQNSTHAQFSFSKMPKMKLGNWKGDERMRVCVCVCVCLLLAWQCRPTNNSLIRLLLLLLVKYPATQPINSTAIIFPLFNWGVEKWRASENQRNSMKNKWKWARHRNLNSYWANWWRK